ncbi:TPA: hypothetical protein ACGIK9_002816 [Acinetobacter baumannii]|uniref:hypothetical protein n=1 Tax=Acinetobacter baumannii TaxID=470 RepID=UPI00338DC1D5
MKHFKKSIVLSIVPLFVFTACSNNNEEPRLAVPNTDSQVVKNQDGSYSQALASAKADQPLDTLPNSDYKSENYNQQLKDAYNEAKSKGYKGSYDDFIALSKLHETEPEQAERKAAESGYSGGTLALAALAGVALGSMAANSSASNYNSSSSYSQQRVNNANNYAYSQPDQREKDRRSSYVGTSTYSGSSTTRPRSDSYNNSSNTSARSSSSYSSSSSSRATASYGSVARGGFGGAVSSGG